MGRFDLAGAGQGVGDGRQREHAKEQRKKRREPRRMSATPVHALPYHPGRRTQRYAITGAAGVASESAD